MMERVGRGSCRERGFSRVLERATSTSAWLALRNSDGKGLSYERCRGSESGAPLQRGAAVTVAGAGTVAPKDPRGVGKGVRTWDLRAARRAGYVEARPPPRARV